MPLEFLPRKIWRDLLSPGVVGAGVGDGIMVGAGEVGADGVMVVDRGQHGWTACNKVMNVKRTPKHARPGGTFAHRRPYNRLRKKP